MKIKSASLDCIHAIAKEWERLVYGCLSRPKDKKSAHKVILRPVLVKKQPMLLLEFHEKTRSITKHATVEEALQELFGQYGELFLRFQHEEWQCVIANGEIRGTKRVLSEEVPRELSHNLQKNHIIQEGKPIQFLIELGLMNQAGKIVPHAQDKFRQINRFLEMVRDLNYTPHSIVDLGCGKAYLTFALYYYFNTILGLDVEVTGVDLKDEVLEKCAQIAARLGFKKLSFQKGTIADYKPVSPPDMTVALHACNVASDQAIDQAIGWKSHAILVAPCCQHALYHTLAKSDYPAAIHHPLLQTRYAALLTDGLRAERLEKAGYKVQLIEFIDPEHTPKNLLIRANRIYGPEWT